MELIDKLKKHKLTIFCIIFLMLGLVGGTWYQSQKQIAKDSALTRLEVVFELYKGHYGKSTENELYLRDQLNLANIPNEYWKQNLTIEEIISAYESYQPPSKLMMGVLLGYICGS